MRGETSRGGCGRTLLTLLMAAAPEQPVFQQVLDKFYGGKPDRWTLQLLGLEG